MGKTRQSVATVTLAALMLASCGGGGGGSNTGGSGPVTVTPTPTPTPSATCALAARQAFAKAVIDEWYLFPNDVASGVSPASHSNVESYIDALVAPARGAPQEGRQAPHPLVPNACFDRRDPFRQWALAEKQLTIGSLERRDLQA